MYGYAVPGGVRMDMADSPDIRAGRAEDLGAILEIYNHYVRRSPATFEVEPVTVTDRQGWLEEHTHSPKHLLLVADSPEGVLGWATSSRFRPRAAYDTTVEASVYCAPTAVGRGLGTRLYRALFDRLATVDLERIVAGVTLPNAASVRLHERFGFRHVGTFTRVGRKFGNYWDVAWYERPARPGPGDPGLERVA